MNNSKKVSKSNLKFKFKPNRNQSLSNNRLKSQNLSQSSKFLSTKKMSSMMKLLRSCKLSSITCALLPNLLPSIPNTIRSRMKSSFKLSLFFQFSHSSRPLMPKTTNSSKTSLHKVPNPTHKRLLVTSKQVLLKIKFPKSFLKIDASSLPNLPLKLYPKSSLCCSAVWKTCLKKLSFISNHFTRWLKSNHKSSSSSRYPFLWKSRITEFSFKSSKSHRSSFSKGKTDSFLKRWKNCTRTSHLREKNASNWRSNAENCHITRKKQSQSSNQTLQKATHQTSKSQSQ